MHVYDDIRCKHIHGVSLRSGVRVSMQVIIFDVSARSLCNGDGYERAASSLRAT